MFSSFAGICFAVKYKSKENVWSLTIKSLTKFWKTVYGKIFRKPFSFQNTRMLCSTLLSFLFLCLCSPSLPLLSAQLCRATPSRPFLAQPPPPRAGPDALCLCSFSSPSLCRPISGPDEAVGELLVEGDAVGLELGLELVVEGGAMGLELWLKLLVDGGARGLLGLWICDGGFVWWWLCCDGSFVGLFMVVCDGLLWWICTCSGFAVSNLFFFHFTLFQIL